MGKKGSNPPAKKPDGAPDWYWKRGLHDAVILAVEELEFIPDWNEKHPRRNCLVLRLDSRHALFDTTVKRISLYNYRIAELKRNAAEPVALDAFTGVYWLGDRIKQLEDGKYVLEIECTDSRGDLIRLAVKFEFPEIERA